MCCIYFFTSQGQFCIGNNKYFVGSVTVSEKRSLDSDITFPDETIQETDLSPKTTTKSKTSLFQT